MHRGNNVAANVSHSALTASTDLKAVRSVDSMHTFVTDDEIIAAQHQSQPAIAEPTALHRDLFKPLDHARIVFALHAVLCNGSRTFREATSCALTNSLGLQCPHGIFSLRGLQDFFESRCLSRRFRALDWK
jgi:hypothetical protein